MNDAQQVHWLSQVAQSIALVERFSPSDHGSNWKAETLIVAAKLAQMDENSLREALLALTTRHGENLEKILSILEMSEIVAESYERDRGKDTANE